MLLSFKSLFRDRGFRLCTEGAQSCLDLQLIFSNTNVKLYYYDYYLFFWLLLVLLFANGVVSCQENLFSRGYVLD